MTPTRARSLLLCIFILCLVLQCGVLVLNQSAMWPEDLLKSLLTLLKLYSVPLAVIFGGIFARPGGATGPSAGVSWAAVLVASCWNLLLVWRTIAFGLASQDSVSDLTKYLEDVSSAASFLVAGMLAFFFGKSSK